MGIVGKIRKVLRDNKALGVAVEGIGETFRRKFEKQTTAGKRWKSFYKSLSGGQSLGYGNANINVSGSSASQLANTGFRSYR